MKSLFVVSTVAGGSARKSRDLVPASERRKTQRRMGIARRIVPERRAGKGTDGASDRRESSDRRASSNRRRRHDRRIGLSPDLDLFLLGI